MSSNTLDSFPTVIRALPSLRDLWVCYVHTHTHTHTHTHLHTDIHTHTTCMHLTKVHTATHTHVHTDNTHTCVCTYTYMCTNMITRKSQMRWTLHYDGKEICTVYSHVTNPDSTTIYRSLCFFHRNLHNNHIKTIPEHAFIGNPSLETMWVEQGPGCLGSGAASGSLAPRLWCPGVYS